MLLKHGMKKIVYLDQNWLSDLTKAHLAEDTRVDKGILRRALPSS